MKLPKCFLESRDPHETSLWDELWFAIAHEYKKLGKCVFMTPSWDAFCKEFESLKENGVSFTVWCGTYREIEAFRAHSHAQQPHEEDS